ncbi:MAG: YkgJ family cysteine cluster protein [Candidatus Altiarchaeota archaeon]|nr:YkgJ family cysteine cluster protein [Candidatus Altiarchaeota archaeon]
MGECVGCGGRCCMEYIVSLSAMDVRRIAENTKFSPEFFADFTPVDEMESRCQDVRIDGKYFYMTLRRDERGCCVLSKLEGDDIKCMVHGFHPLVCRIYPFTEYEGEVVHRRKFRCESKWQLDLETKDRIKATLEQRDEEIRRFNKIAREWNGRGGGGRKEFLSFIL